MAIVQLLKEIQKLATTYIADAHFSPRTRLPNAILKSLQRIEAFSRLLNDLKGLAGPLSISWDTGSTYCYADVTAAP